MLLERRAIVVNGSGILEVLDFFVDLLVCEDVEEGLGTINTQRGGAVIEMGHGVCGWRRSMVETWEDMDGVRVQSI